MLAQIALLGRFDPLDVGAPYEVLGAGAEATEGQLRVELNINVGAKALAWQIFSLYDTHHTMRGLMRDREADAVALEGSQTLIQAARPRQA